MDNQDIIERIRFIMNEMRLNQFNFAKRIDTDPSNFSKHLNGKLPINESLINKIVVNLGVSKNWLKNGNDVPFPRNKEPETVTVGQLAEKDSGSPVYDIDVTAGTASREMMFADDRIIGHVNVPGVSSDCKIVRVSGNSMEPVINNGDYIAVREIHDTSVIFWGQIYVIMLEDYRMVKYLRKHTDENKVILRSANKDYDDIELPKTAIRGLLFVNNIIHIDTRM